MREEKEKMCVDEMVEATEGRRKVFFLSKQKKTNSDKSYIFDQKIINEF